MEANQASRTALYSAYFRGYHSEHVNPKIFNDYLANKLLTLEERNLFDKLGLSGLTVYDPKLAASFPDDASALAFMTQLLPGPPQILSRARYTEDLLEEAVKQGVKQYIILGAGMDTFGFRRTDMLGQLEVFEVDHPATQKSKLHRLNEAKWEIPSQLHFVPVDFTKQNLVEALNQTSYDPNKMSFFSWLGVTYYLTYDEAVSTLHNIAEASPVGSSIVFDYLDTDAFDSSKAALRVQAMMYGAKQMGEEMKLGLTPSLFAEELNKIGLRLREDLSPSEIQSRYFQGRTDKYCALEHLHIACVEVEKGSN